MTPLNVGTPRLGCPLTGACDGSIRSGVGRTRHVVAGFGVANSANVAVGTSGKDGLGASGSAGDVDGAEVSATGVDDEHAVAKKRAPTRRRFMATSSPDDWGRGWGNRITEAG